MNNSIWKRLSNAMFSLVYNDRVQKIFLNIVKLNIKFIGFISNSKAGSRLYAVILILAFFEIFGKTGTFIFSSIMYYIIIVALLLVFAVKFPPMRSKMYEAFGKDFILKFLGNPGNIPLKAVAAAAMGGVLMGAANEAVKTWQTSRMASRAEQMKGWQHAEWKERGYLPSDADKDALFQRTEEMAQKEPEGLAELGTVVKSVIEKALE